MNRLLIGLGVAAALLAAVVLAVGSQLPLPDVKVSDLNPSNLLWVAGVVAGVGLVAALGLISTLSTAMLRTALMTSLVLGLTGLLVAGIQAGTLQAPAAAVILILGTIMLPVTFATLDALAEDEGVRFDTHWGGLGGSLGGWRLSRAATLILLLLALGGAVVGASMGLAPEEKKKADEAAHTDPEKATTPKAASDATPSAPVQSAPAATATPAAKAPDAKAAPDAKTQAPAAKAGQ